MAKHMDITAAHDSEQLYIVAKALASRQRIEILKLLRNSLNVNEIAERLEIPPSSAAMHIRVLERAGLIFAESQPGIRGIMKLCSCKKDSITISINSYPNDVRQVESYSMPVGNFVDCDIYPTCGLASATSHLVNEDSPASFYIPERTAAKLVWTSAGYLEYRFPNNSINTGKAVRKISVSAELCSEAPNYRENWRSDITLWINGVDCGAWRCPGDFGSRRGRLTPEWWHATQYGLLTTWSVDKEGGSINSIKNNAATIDALNISEAPYITVRLGNRPDAENIGGINIFGDCFGDYEQDIVLTMEY